MGNGVLVAIVALALFLLWLAMGLPPRRTTLDKARPNRYFGGLIRFGKEGSFVVVYKHVSGDRVLFRKNYLDEEHWRLRVLITSQSIRPALVNDIESAVSLYGQRLVITSGPRIRDGDVEFLVEGAQLQDKYALEGLARLIVEKLGHSRDDKYRIVFAGPKDGDKFNEYFGFKRTKG